MNCKPNSSMTVAMMVASMFAMSAATAAVAQDQHQGKVQVKCEGSSTCKSHGACKQASNACKGKNACKGQGFTVQESEAACEKAQAKARAKP